MLLRFLFLVVGLYISAFYHADTALRLAPFVCIIGVSPHPQHTAKVCYGVLVQYNSLNLQAPVAEIR